MNFQLADISAKRDAIIAAVRQVIQEANIKNIDLPEMQESRRPISIAFVGQYSAGKSTILKMLTGRNDIATGAGITTQQAHEFEWSGLRIVDTPGIHTELRSDHDTISYQKIAQSDMLVFVVTNELFDSHIGEHFRKLAVEKDKGKEMILVVNKMERESNGNIPEQQEVKIKDLRKVLVPYTPEQLRTCFVDAESYLDGTKETDKEYADQLRQRSGYGQFITTLNQFVEEQGINAQLTTVFYEIEDAIQKALNQISPKSGDADIDALEEALLQKKNIVLQCRRNIEIDIDRVCAEISSNIRQLGVETADKAIVSDTPNKEIEEAGQQCGIICEKGKQDIIKKLEEELRDYQAELDKFYKREIWTTLSVRLDSKTDNSPILKRIKEGSRALAPGSEIIDKMTGNVSWFGKLTNFSGTKAHSLIKNVGHFFGKSFKPWEAVKYTKAFATAGKVLGVVAIVVPIGMQIWEDIQEAKLEQAIRDNRCNIRKGFNDVAAEFEHSVREGLDNILKETYNKQLDEISNKRAILSENRSKKNKHYKALEEQLTETRQMIKRIQSSTSR